MLTNLKYQYCSWAWMWRCWKRFGSQIHFSTTGSTATSTPSQGQINYSGAIYTSWCFACPWWPRQTLTFDGQDLWGGGHNIQHAADHQGQVPDDALQLSHGLAIVSSHIWLMWVFHSHEGPAKELKWWEPQWWWWWQEIEIEIESSS